MSLKISQSGIRGTSGPTDKNFSPTEILNFFLAYGQYLQSLKKSNVKIAIGLDGRRSSKALSCLAQASLASIGCETLNGGLIMTPTLQSNIRLDKDVDGGIMITASHNPPKYAGFKLFNSDGELVSDSEIKEIQILKDKGEFPYRSFESFSNINDTSYRETFIRNHIENVIAHLDVEEIKKNNFKVALDCCNSSGIMMIDFLKLLGCEVFSINHQVTGDFNRSPEPSLESLEDLTHLVQSTKADIGLALDPDGDRLILVDNNGKVLPEDYTFLLILYHLLNSTNPRKNIVTSITISSALKRIIANSKREIFVHETPVGEKSLTEKINQLGKDDVLIAGEDTGSAIIPWINLARDSITNAGIILMMLTNMKGITLSDIMNILPRSNRKKFKIPIDDNISFKIQKNLNSFKNNSDLSCSTQIKKSENYIHFLDVSGDANIKIEVEKQKIILLFKIDNEKYFPLELTNFFSIDEIYYLRDMFIGGKFDLNFKDGLKISWDDGFLLMRLSNTEPIMRLILDYQRGEGNEKSNL
ncbi:hypothetical protein KKB18_01645 [bacterium]|nr:hypothetical protein [bacterium]